MKNTRILSFTIALATIFGLVGCGNGSDPSVPTNDPTETPSESTTDGPTLPPFEEKELLEGFAPDGHKYFEGSQMYDTEFEDIDGNIHNLRDVLKEKELVVINLFASWCGPCASEMPSLQEAYLEYKDKVEVFALDIEITDTVSTLRTKFVERYMLTFPVCLDVYEDTEHYFSTDSSIPKSFFVDRYGTIVSIHKGSIVSKKGWTNIFDEYIGDSYIPPVFDDPSNDQPTEDPTEDIVIDVEMPESSEIERVINDSSYNFGYYNATGNDAENNWPWIISENNESIQPSNSGVDNSYSIINTDFVVEDIYNNVLAFDYYSSTEAGYDNFYVIIDGTIVDTISGESDDWETCFAYVPDSLGKHTLTLVYQKDESSESGDDTVYVKNMRFISVENIDKDMHIKRYAPQGYDETTGRYTQYQTLVLNEEDGYYHIDSADGALLLAEMNRYTPFSDTNSVYGFIVEGFGVVGDVDYSATITEYAEYANNSTNGLTPITVELKEALQAVINNVGDNDSENQWQEVCYYYDAYGPTAEHLPSPIYGLAMFDAIPATEGVEVTVEFDRVIVPRGKYVEFTPSKSGVYRVITINEDPTFGSIYNSKGEVIEESTPYNHCQVALENTDDDLIMHEYMEAGETYYVRSAFHFPDQTGSYKILITYVGEEYDFLTLAAESTAFTTKDEDFNVDDPDAIISPSIDITLHDDGYYYELKENNELGSAIYADLLNKSSMFFLKGVGVSLKTIVENGGALLEWYTEEGDLVDTEDYTEVFEKYIEIAENSVSDDNPYGLIKVNEELANALQRLMDYYTFYGVKNSWLKLCYYYKHYGPNA